MAKCEKHNIAFPDGKSCAKCTALEQQRHFNKAKKNKSNSSSSFRSALVLRLFFTLLVTGTISGIYAASWNSEFSILVGLFIIPPLIIITFLSFFLSVLPVWIFLEKKNTLTIDRLFSGSFLMGLLIGVIPMFQVMLGITGWGSLELATISCFVSGIYSLILGIILWLVRISVAPIIFIQGKQQTPLRLLPSTIAVMTASSLLIVLQNNETYSKTLDIIQQNRITVMMDKLACEVENISFNNGPVSTEGYLRKIKTDDIGDSAHINFVSYNLDNILDDLAVKRFRFVEEENSEARKNSYRYGMQNSAVGNGSRYFRYRLAEKDSPACEFFYMKVKEHWPFRRRVQELGLGDDLCIAIEKTDTSFAKYEIAYERTNSKYFSKTDLLWQLFTVRDINSNTTVATYRQFSYGGGTVHNVGGVHTCYNNDDFQRILKKTITSNDKTLFFDSISLTADSPIRAFYEKQYSSAPRIVKPQSFPSIIFVNAKVKDENSLTLKGGVLHEFSAPPNLSADTDANGKAYSMRSRDCSNYQCFVINNGSESIRTPIPVDMEGLQPASSEVNVAYFHDQKYTAVTEIGSNLRSFWILTYKTDGELLSRVNVAVPFIKWKGFPRKPIKSIVESDQQYLISILDMAHKENRRGFDIVAEYVLEVPKPK